MARPTFAAALFVFVALILYPGISRSEDKPPADPRAKIETLIPHAIELLKQKKFIPFLQLADPATLKKLEMMPGGLAKLAEQYEPEIVEALIDEMQKLAKKKPELSPDGRRAFYRGFTPFVKIGDLWYLEEIDDE
jgi:hypothetical protein